MNERVIEYQDGEAKFTGLLVRDDDVDTSPGVLVVHGGAGLDDHAKGRARQLARLGYVAFACDMYGEGVRGDSDRVIACITQLRKDRARLAARAIAAVGVLAADRHVNGRIAAVGYCFGGLVVLELARSGADLAAAISVHGSLETTRRARRGDIKAKILVCHGALDPHVPVAQLTGFIEEMNDADADWQLIVYGGAMHGFTHDTGPSAPGVAYHPRTDTRSLNAIRTFLEDAVGPETTQRP
jgi:dienelactone hydrolase